jgi:hypothetical protein
MLSNQGLSSGEKEKAGGGRGVLTQSQMPFVQSGVEPKGRTNRICPRKQFRVKRSRPGMYTEPIGHPNKPGPDYGVVFP